MSDNGGNGKYNGARILLHMEDKDGKLMITFGAGVPIEKIGYALRIANIQFDDVCRKMLMVKDDNKIITKDSIIGRIRQ